MSTYKIANIVFAINFAINDAWCQFSTDAEQCDFEVVKENPFYSEYQIYGYKLFPWNCERVFLYDTYTIVVDKEWEKVSLISSTIREKVSSLLIMIFNTHAVQRHMIQIHSSMIEYSGNGLLFLRWCLCWCFCCFPCCSGTFLRKHASGSGRRWRRR